MKLYSCVLIVYFGLYVAYGRFYMIYCVVYVSG